MFSMCSELTPRAPIPDTRIPQLMQPCCLVYQKITLFHCSKILYTTIMPIQINGPYCFMGFMKSQCRDGWDGMGHTLQTDTTTRAPGRLTSLCSRRRGRLDHFSVEQDYAGEASCWSWSFGLELLVHQSAPRLLLHYLLTTYPHITKKKKGVCR